jgi:hypothetical protein
VSIEDEGTGPGQLPPGVAAALATAEIPPSKLGPARRARLSEAERELYVWILRRFATDGRPSSEEVGAAAESLGIGPDDALETLAREDLVHRGAEGEVSVAYPFSGRPTAHRVRFSEGKSTRPAEPYLAASAAEARRLGHNYVGTEHVLLVLVRNRAGGATMVLQQFGVTADEVERALSPCIGGGAPKIDPDALATLGIDFQAVRERLEETFGPKQAFAYALDYAHGRPLGDEHILLGMLSVPDSLAADILAKLGVSLQGVEAIVGSHRE